MIKKLCIKNYKSIKGLNIYPKRVNILIGEHNTGKSNILEALNWFSFNGLNQENFNDLFRFKNVANFFFDSNGNNPIEISTDVLSCKIRYATSNQGANYDHFEGAIYPSEEKIEDDKNQFNRQPELPVSIFRLPFKENTILNDKVGVQTNFRTYQFKRLSEFKNNHISFLNPPFGENIPTLLRINSDLRQIVSEFIKNKGYRLLIKPTENDIEIAKDLKDELYSFPYQTISETIQRYIFLLLAIETNENAILVLDEPESNMFPFFVKEFAERIAMDQTNQFFLSTHNPYLLGSLLEKTPINEVAVFVTKMEDFETLVTPCTEEQIQELISSDSGAFFSLDNILHQ